MTGASAQACQAAPRPATGPRDDPPPYSAHHHGCGLRLTADAARALQQMRSQRLVHILAGQSRLAASQRPQAQRTEAPRPEVSRPQAPAAEGPAHTIHVNASSKVTGHDNFIDASEFSSNSIHAASAVVDRLIENASDPSSRTSPVRVYFDLSITVDGDRNKLISSSAARREGAVDEASQPQDTGLTATPETGTSAGQDEHAGAAGEHETSTEPLGEAETHAILAETFASSAVPETHGNESLSAVEDSDVPANAATRNKRKRSAPAANPAPAKRGRGRPRKNQG